MIGFCPLASGSKGNCIFVGSHETKILIDVGLSYRQLVLRLDEIGVRVDQIDAVLISHEHTDHISGVSILTAKHDIPIFANSDTAKEMIDTLGTSLKFKIFSTGESFTFGDLEIFPFSVQHDTPDPVAFTIQLVGYKCGFCTDLGFVTSQVIEHLKGCDYLYLEANHETSMVHASPRHAHYKQRVLSRQGHLSNDECAALIEQIYHENLKHIYLAHLSSECNSEARALKTIKEKLVSLKATTEVSIAYQNRVSAPLHLKEKSMIHEEA